MNVPASAQTTTKATKADVAGKPGAILLPFDKVERASTPECRVAQRACWEGTNIILVCPKCSLTFCRSGCLQSSVAAVFGRLSTYLCAGGNK